MSDQSTLFSTLLRYIHADVPKCPEPLISQKIWLCIREFCHETQCWQMELDPITIRDGKTDYDLDGWPVSYAEIDRVLTVENDGALLTPVTDYVILENALIRLTAEPAADKDKALQITVALRPCVDADKIDKDVFSNFFTAWVDGVLYTLMVEPGKPWSNPTSASFHYARYYSAMSNAKGQMARGNTNRRLQISTYNRMV